MIPRAARGDAEETRVDIFEKCLSFTRADDLKAAGLYPYFTPIQEAAGNRIRVDGRPMIMVGSNNYLGLAHHPRPKEAAKDAVDRYGVGTCGSRFLTGTIDLHEELEERLARFLKREAALTRRHPRSLREMRPGTGDHLSRPRGNPS